MCAVLLQLTNRDRSLFFINALSGVASAYFLRFCSSDIPLRKIKFLMRKRYNSEAQQEHLFDTLHALRLSYFMTQRKISDGKKGLRQLNDYIKQTTALLPSEYQNENHKTRIMRNALAIIPETQSLFHRSSRKNSISINLRQH